MERHLLRKEKKIEQILEHKLSMVQRWVKTLEQKGKHQQLKEDLLVEDLVHHHHLTEEIHKEVGLKVNYL